LQCHLRARAQGCGKSSLILASLGKPSNIAQLILIIGGFGDDLLLLFDFASAHDRDLRQNVTVVVSPWKGGFAGLPFLFTRYDGRRRM